MVTSLELLVLNSGYLQSVSEATVDKQIGWWHVDEYTQKMKLRSKYQLSGARDVIGISITFVLDKVKIFNAQYLSVSLDK